MKETLEKLKNKKIQDRDLLIDELSTLFEYKSLSKGEENLVITELIQQLEHEEEDSVIESIFNLLGIAFAEGICVELIARKSAEMLPDLKPGSLVHALQIVGDSQLENNFSLIEPFLDSENSAVRDAAQGAMQPS